MRANSKSFFQLALEASIQTNTYNYEAKCDNPLAIISVYWGVTADKYFK
jgi:hypothetical protein